MGTSDSPSARNSGLTQESDMPSYSSLSMKSGCRRRCSNHCLTSSSFISDTGFCCLVGSFIGILHQLGLAMGLALVSFRFLVGHIGDVVGMLGPRFAGEQVVDSEPLDAGELPPRAIGVESSGRGVGE